MKMIRLKIKIVVIIFISISVFLMLLSVESFLRIKAISTTTTELHNHSTKRSLLLASYYTYSDIETSTRGQVLIGSSLFTDIRKRALKKLPEILFQLKEILKDDPISTYYFNKLSSEYNSRIMILNTLFHQPNKSKQLEIINNSAAQSERCRLIVEKILREQDAEIIHINQRLKNNLEAAPIIMLFLITFFVIFLLVGFLSLVNQLSVSKKLQKNLEDSNSSLEIANKSLAQSQAFLNSIIESSPSEIITYQAVRNEIGNIIDFKVVFISRGELMINSEENDNQLGKTITEIYPSIKETELYQKLVEVTEKGIPEFFEFYNPNLISNANWFEIHLSRLNDGATLNSRNITHLKKAQEELSKHIEMLYESNKELDSQKNFAFTVYNSLPDSIITVDHDLNLTYANSSFYRFTKINESVIGKNLRDVIGRNVDVSKVLKGLNGEYVIQQEYFDHKSGKFFDHHIIPLKNNSNEISNAIIITHDITEKVQANKEINKYIEELKKTNEQLRHFTFIASHDLQEPLRKIETFSNKLLERFSDDINISSEINKIRSSASRMSELLVAISKYTRLQVINTVLQVVDLNQIAQQVLYDLELQINAKKAIINIDPLPTISCDPIQISQLFLNLISNSLKFCNRRPEIEVKCTTVDEPVVLNNLQPDYKYYRFRFKDNGIGFNTEYIQKMFIIFQRLHDTKKYPGTGVGLAMCQKIVENHKGKISVYSRENEGSTFDIYLPANLT